MNDLELRLREALQRSDLEIDVTGEDLRHAEHLFLRRRDELSKRRRTWMAAGVAAAAVAAIAAGTVIAQTPDEPSITPAEQSGAEELVPEGQLPLTPANLAGLWMMPGRTGWLWTFTADGTFSPRNPGDHYLDDWPSSHYTIDGTVLSMPQDECEFEATVGPRGLLTLTPVGERTCFGEVDTGLTLTKLSSASSTGTAITWSGPGPADGTRRIEWIGATRGAYLHEGTGQVLLFDYDARRDTTSYRLDDDGGLFADPDDEGSVVLDEVGNLVLTSSLDSAGCEPGSTVLLTGVAVLTTGENTVPLGRALQWDVTPNGCGLHHDLAGTWIRVS
jgi:hypothetical protein